jgi:hypothetical protein
MDNERHAIEAAAPSGCYTPSHEETVELRAMFTAYQKLKALGWNDAVYCPKDGTVFLSISAGSTGVHETTYMGEWPKGGWWVHDGGDVWPAHPILWKAKD